MEKIQNGTYIDFKELLSDNVELVKRLRELGVSNPQLPGNSSRLREIQDPISWVRCFLLFLAARVNNQETRDLAAYAITVIDLARCHGGRGWLSYDSRFRQLKAAGAPFPWTEVNSSVMASTVLSFTGSTNRGLSCDLCFASGHTKADCALLAMEPKASSASLQQDRSLNRSRPAKVNETNICRRFNRGSCFGPSCRFEHACSLCLRQGHAALECPKYRKKLLPSTPAGKSS